MAAKLQPLADRVLVKPIEKEEKTKSGIYLPDTAKEKPQEGEILAVGPGKMTDDGKRVPLDLKAGDQFEIARLQWTNGISFNIDNAAVVEKLQEWDKRFGLDLVGAGFDWVEAEFVNLPEDMSAFAKEVYEFCPDSVDQGAGSVQALAEDMKRANTVYLWWD